MLRQCVLALLLVACAPSTSAPASTTVSSPPTVPTPTSDQVDAAIDSTFDAAPDAIDTSDACVYPSTWLLYAAICPNARSCGNCRVTDPDDRDAGIGVSISGCVHTFAGAQRVHCVDSCEGDCL